MQQIQTIKGQSLLKLMQFSDRLSQYPVSVRPSTINPCNPNTLEQATNQYSDLNHWTDFVETFFAPKGVMCHTIPSDDLKTKSKQFEITFPALARYFHTHFESGVTEMQMIVERGVESQFGQNMWHVQSEKTSFVYWFENGSQVCRRHVTSYINIFNSLLGGREGPITRDFQ